MDRQFRGQDSCSTWWTPDKLVYIWMRTTRIPGVPLFEDYSVAEMREHYSGMTLGCLPVNILFFFKFDLSGHYIQFVNNITELERTHSI